MSRFSLAGNSVESIHQTRTIGVLVILRMPILLQTEFFDRVDHYCSLPKLDQFVHRHRLQAIDDGSWQWPKPLFHENTQHAALAVLQAFLSAFLSAFDNTAVIRCQIHRRYSRLLPCEHGIEFRLELIVKRQIGLNAVAQVEPFLIGQFRTGDNAARRPFRASPLGLSVSS